MADGDAQSGTYRDPMLPREPKAFRDPMMPRDPMVPRDPMIPREPAFKPRHERQFVEGEGLRSAKRRVIDVERTAPVLLNDEQIAHFIANGYLVLDPLLPAAFHAAVFDKFVEIAGADSDNDTGNNILPVVPEIHEVFEDGVVKGALQSVLGPNYFLHPHRALHTNPPGTPPQAFHHDTYWGYKRKVHNHHPYWVMIMYYPQKIYREIGPTGVVPGTHTIAQRLDDIAQIEIAGEGPGGTCMMIHFDVWHRKMQNFTNNERFMLKCQFVRLERPTAPTWNNKRTDWVSPEKLPAYRMEPVWREHWEWLSGRQGARPVTNPATIDIEGLRRALGADDPATRREAIAAIALGGTAGEALIPDLVAHLDDHSEPVGLSAAYTLGALGQVAIAPLVAAMLANDGENVDDARVFIDEGQKSELEMKARNAAHGLVAIGADAVPALLAAYPTAQARARKYIAFALGEIGVETEAVHKTLAAAASDVDENVRINAIEALGLKQGSPVVLEALSKALDDDEDEVRFNAALSFARLGRLGEPALPALIRALNDGNRYTLGYAVEAIERIGTPAAMAALVPYLKSVRWCPMTNNHSLF